MTPSSINFLPNNRYKMLLSLRKSHLRELTGIKGSNSQFGWLRKPHNKFGRSIYPIAVVRTMLILSVNVCSDGWCDTLRRCTNWVSATRVRSKLTRPNPNSIRTLCRARSSVKSHPNSNPTWNRPGPKPDLLNKAKAGLNLTRTWLQTYLGRDESSASSSKRSCSL